MSVTLVNACQCIKNVGLLSCDSGECCRGEFGWQLKAKRSCK
ncbi:hypothetical protein ALTERO38_60617 [Alteromonas sp. 38]|nr:hypothetical protein ALTER154_40178 [Alteromonas sp. 154]VXC27839.1 hypothetical protein ALTERO38_60617 [Alteromonas sp. 38]